VVENAEALADTDALVEYCQAPHLETCLVFTAVKATKKKLHELLKRSAVLVRCQRLKGRALVKWISDSARHDGLKLTPEAATTLTDLAGDHLRQLRNELDKLGTHLGSGGSIGAEEVQQLVGDSRANTIFELIDAVSAGRLEAALRMLAKLVTARESLPGIVAMLGRHFRNLWKTQLLGDRRATAGLVASELGVPPFVARRYLEQAQRFSGAQLRHMLIQLFRADQDLKMSTIPATLVVEKLLLEFTLAGQKESAEGGQRMRG
jgi:DNA polymerase-3 subunit delta